MSSPSPAPRHRGRGRGRRSLSSTPVPNTSRFATKPSSAAAAATPSGVATSPSSSEYAYDTGSVDQMYVWGTNISVQDANTAILRFLRNFREGNVAADSLEEGKYVKELDRVLELERERINGADLYECDQDLYNEMVRYPSEVLAIFEIVLMDIDSGRNPLY